MFYARKPLIRSACLIAAAAASFVTLSSGLAQERNSRLELAGAVGQQAASPVLNPLAAPTPAMAAERRRKR